ncbi:MAG: TonB-dependent receptor plug domain-containing protein, partial [Muribaculaceae bacterium]|nr:TonB-dependent receptor plug domain-containing protein [Muribaculaceae bacterium]
MSKHLLVTLLLTCGMPLGGSMTALANPEPQSQQQGVESITGTVYDENNEPVIGATVALSGSKDMGVTTDVDGHFVLRARVGSNLTVSYVGYKTETVKAARDIQVYLQPTTEVLDQLVVVGYGEQKRANLTGAVATVDVARTMDSRPVQDATKALQGAVPGLTITTTNGGISESANIKIRGVGTLSNSQESAPLIVVDGVPTDNLDFINPEDIAEISVLKDASSSAIYGARAAFGVILVTTKTASTKDRVSVKYDNNFSWSRATVLPTFAKLTDNITQALQSAKRGNGAMETEVGKQRYEQLYLWAEKWERAHGNNLYSDFVNLQPYVDENNIGDYYVTPEGKWFTYAQWGNDAIFNNAAPSQKHNISLEGTSGKTQYRASFGFDSKQGLLKAAPDQMKRYMASMSVSTEIFKFLKAGARFNFSQREYTDPNTIRNTYQYFWRWNTAEQVFGYAEHDGKMLYFHNPMSDRLLAHTDKQTSNQTRMQAWMLA